jgi:hypothetical protein
MRGLMFSFLFLGVTTAIVCGGALVFWDMAGANQPEAWRMQTGSTGCLTLWLAFMILYIDRLWQQRTSAAAHPGNRLAGDAFLGWVLVAVSLVLGWSGVAAWFDQPPVGTTRSIPLGVIRIGMSGLILAFGACVLREGDRRRRIEESMVWSPVQPSSLAAARTGGQMESASGGR